MRISFTNGQQQRQQVAVGLLRELHQQLTNECWLAVGPLLAGMPTVGQQQEKPNNEANLGIFLRCYGFAVMPV